jgi:hypothetical protein
VYDTLVALFSPCADPAQLAARTAWLQGGVARPHMLVAVNATTLLGLDDDPGHVLGGTALPGEVVRRIATSATWQSMITDAATARLVTLGDAVLPPGDVFETDDDQFGPEWDRPRDWPSESFACGTYAASTRMKRLIAVRDQRCANPVCSQPAWRCQHDHIEEFDRSVPARFQTVAGNLTLLCQSCHNLKTHHGWDTTRDPDTGAMTITSALGLTYPVEPRTPLGPNPATLRRDHADPVPHVPDLQPVNPRDWDWDDTTPHATA